MRSKKDVDKVTLDLRITLDKKNNYRRHDKLHYDYVIHVRIDDELYDMLIDLEDVGWKKSNIIRSSLKVLIPELHKIVCQAKKPGHPIDLIPSRGEGGGGN